MTVAEQLDTDGADTALIAVALCKGEALEGAAPCRCDRKPSLCAAQEIYASQAGAVLAALKTAGRLAVAS